MRVFVDRRYIAYRAPFAVEVFRTGLVIGVDAGGFNCVRFDGAPLAFGCTDRAFMERAVEALNAEQVSLMIYALIE